MALSESGLAGQGVKVGQVTYGSSGRRKTVRPKKGPAKKIAVRRGGKQSFFVSKGRR